jgi:pyridoxine kinase
LLSGCNITNEQDALEAMKVLHNKGVRIVILSSTEFSQGEDDQLVCLASQKLKDNTYQTARIAFPRLPTHFVGTGDLFTALTTAWLQHDSFDIKIVLEKTIATMQAVLKRTLHSAMSKGGPNPSPAQLELKLIQSRTDILDPKVATKATIIVDRIQ